MKLGKSKYLLVVVLLWLGCQSCFQFRQSDKKQLKELRNIPPDCNVELGFKNGLDRKIHYTLVSSDSSLPLAVFVHGSPGSSSNFLTYAADSLLLKKYNVLLIDRPGFGYSDFGKSEPSISDQASILNEVIDQFDYQHKILVGHSLGGPIICKMAMDEPELIDGLLIVAGSVSPELEPEEKWRKPLSGKWISWILPKSFRVSNEEILPTKKELEQMESQWKKIICDVQIIQGGKDKLVPAGNEDFAERKLINARSVKVYRLDDQNHFIPFTTPELIVEALFRFSF
ncbi:MAG: alpha/beta fold hydrolase [Bacteroidia bacterium]